MKKQPKGRDFKMKSATLDRRHAAGFVDDNALFRDATGRRISNAQVYREVEEGARYFWSKRKAVSRPTF